MNIKYSENKIIVNSCGSFDIKKTFECGQCFRFDPCDGGFCGVAHGKLLTLRQCGGSVEITGISRQEFDGIFADYFDLERDYGEIDSILARDPVLAPIIPFSTGIRILRQEPFETLVSFIISASNNIPRIKKIIGLLCENFGRKSVSDGRVYYSFPTPEALSALQPDDLAVIRAGFRDKYIIDCARKICSGEVNPDEIKNIKYEQACRELMKINGVGQKVADCALLFGFGFLESFPKDVWIKRILLRFYNTQDNKGLPFYGYDGIAQQYLFYYARENALK